MRRSIARSLPRCQNSCLPAGKANLKSTSQILNLKRKVELFPFLTLRTHPIAERFFEAKTKEDLINIKKYSLKHHLPLLILGGGSNLAIIRDKIPGLVVKNSYRNLKILQKNVDNVIISVSSGYPVSQLISETIETGYQGFEYHKGLPGTVGGALYMNSKWTKPLNYFSDNLVFAVLVNKKGNVKKVNKKYFNFNYDFSILQKTKELLLEAVFRLKKVDKKILEKRADESFEYRKKTQPIGQATSGCFFKNPGNQPAGLLIDRSGLKGFRVGDFIVSEKHANFIINLGDGKPEDLLELIEIIKSRVRERFRIELEEEVIII